MEWWVAPLVAILVAAVAASGTWLTFWLSRRAQQLSRLEQAEARADRYAARNLRLINYAGRLRDHISRGDPPPAEEWPDDLYE